MVLGGNKVRKKYKPTIRNRYIFLADLVCIVISVAAAYVIRLEPGALLFYYLPSALWMMLVSLMVKPFVYYTFGLYRRLWVYASISELKQIIMAVTAASVLVSAAVILLFTSKVIYGFPRSVLVIDWLLSVGFVGGVRFGTRIIAEGIVKSSSSKPPAKQKRVLIVGAGDAGAMVVKEMQRSHQLDLLPVGFLDDDLSKQKQQIYGIPVVGTVSDLARVLDVERVHEVVIAIPSAPGNVVRKVADVCRLKSVSFRTMPGLYELIDGKINISRLREVQISDLLRREPKQVRDNRVGEVIEGKKVLITGAGGSIGSELCRQTARWKPAELIMLGHGENSIFEIFLELRSLYPDLKIRPVIADIRDRQRIEQVFQQYQPSAVFHAAAHKHVPMMEINIEDAVSNNVMGTQNIVDISEQCGVEQLIMISTDKAIRPINIMGATKHLAELLVLDAGNRSGKNYSVVRFGNVLGSRGSVIPIIKRQIQQGGPVTVTHPDMKRYFMTIPEAVFLVLQAASFKESGKRYVLNMGQQIRILDLVEDLIRLSGLEPGKDVEIVYTGVRPGEKLSEDLWDEQHSISPTFHPDVFLMKEDDALHGQGLSWVVCQLITLAEEGREEEIVTLLDQTIPGATVKYSRNVDITSI